MSQVDAGLRLAGLRAGPADRRGPDPLGEVGTADPQEQGELDRVHARQGDRKRLVVGPEPRERTGLAEPRLPRAGLQQGTGRVFEGLHVGLQVRRRTDRDGRVDQPAPRDREPGLFPRRPGRTQPCVERISPTFDQTPPTTISIAR